MQISQLSLNDSAIFDAEKFKNQNQQYIFSNVKDLDERERIKKEKTKEECEICLKKQKGFFSKAKFCYFCIRWVCNDHIVKKREDPLEAGEFVEICVQCEDKILYDKLMRKYQDAEKILEDREEKQRSRQKEIDKQLVYNQFQYDKLQKEQEQAIKIHNLKLEKFNKLLMDGSQRMKELEEEAENLHQHYEKLIDRNKLIELEKSNYQNEYEKARQESQNLTYQITNIELDIKQVTFLIKDAERRIQRYKVGLVEQQQEKNGETQKNEKISLNSYVEQNSILASLYSQQKFSQKKEKKDTKITNKSYYCV